MSRSVQILPTYTYVIFFIFHEQPIVDQAHPSLLDLAMLIQQEVTEKH